jgi:hypothetical protein
MNCKRAFVRLIAGEAQRIELLTSFRWVSKVGGEGVKPVGDRCDAKSSISVAVISVKCYYNDNGKAHMK